MQQIVKDFLSLVLRHFPINDPILEIGSYQVQGQEGFADLRPFFPGKQYLGVDMRLGIGVDEVQNVQEMTLADRTKETVIAFDTLEHVANPFKAVEEMYRVLSDEGLLLLSVPFHFEIHDYPHDYWRFTPFCVEMLLEKFSHSIVLWEKSPSDNIPKEVYGIGLKKPLTTLPLYIHSFIAEASLYYGVRTR